MKISFLILNVLIAFHSLSQIKNSVVDLTIDNTIYRGYRNNIELGFKKIDKNDSINLRCDNCDFFPSRYSDSYDLIPGDGREVLFHVTVLKGADTVSYDMHKFRVLNLIDPEVTLGNILKGTTTRHMMVTKLFAKYGPEISLDVHFAVVGWIAKVGRKNFEQKGPGIPKEFREAVQKLRKGKRVDMFVTVKGPDGKLREIPFHFFVDRIAKENIIIKKQYSENC